MSLRSWKPGPMPLTAKRDLYVQLMSQGMRSTEACRQVGVNRKTGQRWRLGRVVRDPKHGEYFYDPIVPPAVEMSKRYLSDEERFVIADGVRAGRSKRSIATELGRSVSTVCREVTRNAEPSGEYRPHAAQQRILAHRPRPKHRRVVLNVELRGLVQERLDNRWRARSRSRRACGLSDRTDPTFTWRRSRSIKRCMPFKRVDEQPKSCAEDGAAASQAAWKRETDEPFHRSDDTAQGPTS